MGDEQRARFYARVRPTFHQMEPCKASFRVEWIGQPVIPQPVFPVHQIVSAVLHFWHLNQNKRLRPVFSKVEATAWMVHLMVWNSSVHSSGQINVPSLFSSISSDSRYRGWLQQVFVQTSGNVTFVVDLCCKKFNIRNLSMMKRLKIFIGERQ
jgi:hypothetical protein